MQFAREVGLTFRVLDYWVRNDVFRPTVEATGSGTRRMYSPALVPKLRTLRRVSAALSIQMGVSTVLLAEVFDAMERGEDSIDLSYGVILSWEPEP